MTFFKAGGKVSAMSSEQEQVRLMAERIARRLSQNGSDAAPEQAENTDKLNHELAAVRASLAELQRRLAHVESHFTDEEGEHAQPAREPRHNQPVSPTQSSEQQTSRPAHSPWLSGMYVPATHPSEEHFGVEEAAVSELVDFFEKEKTCSLEPGGKPCDHCSMCSTRGF